MDDNVFHQWLDGKHYLEIAEEHNIPVDEVLNSIERVRRKIMYDVESRMHEDLRKRWVRRA